MLWEAYTVRHAAEIRERATATNLGMTGSRQIGKIQSPFEAPDGEEEGGEEAIPEGFFGD